jgi:hypothetical protein
METHRISLADARRHSIAVGAMLLLSGCTDLPPTEATATRSRLSAETIEKKDDRGVNLGDCGKVQAPQGSTLVFHAYATGVQIYRWSGSAWTFVAPAANLYADLGGHGLIGKHYAGPTWESVSGSTVVGAVQERCTPDPSAIPWLLLHAQSASGPGIFGRVASIQRLNTVGGNAPTTAGAFAGEVANVPYSAEYFFYSK